MTLKNTDNYKFHIDGKRVTEEEFRKARKLTTCHKFDEYSYKEGGRTVFITEIEA